MDERPLISMQRFAWQYAFCARLVYLKAPATSEQLQGLAETAYLSGKHHDPSAVADLICERWPDAV